MKTEDETMNYRMVKDVYSLWGSFAMPTGEIEEVEGGYRYVGDGYEMKTEITHHATGVNLRSDCICNTGKSPLELRCALSRFSFDGGEYEVYTQYSEWCNESQGAWQPLTSEIAGSNEDLRMNAGANPFVAIRSLQTGRGTAFHILADSTWRYAVKRQFFQSKPKRRNVIVELGINDRGFSYTLQPGETLRLPTILYYEFQNRVDLDAFRLHRYCNEVYPARTMPVIYNSWLSRGDNISYELLADQLAVAKKIGVEYFVIDAGWFGAPKLWYESVGDWVEYKEDSMRGRMKEFADLVRAEGLKFGLWFEFERAAVNSRARTNNPQYYLVEGDQAFIDFSNPEACDYIFNIVAEQIRLYDIAFIKSDFNAPITFDPHRHSFLEFFKGYRAFIDRLRAEFPDLYLQNCASGGLRMALANLRGFDSFWESDSHSLYTQQKIYKDTILRMPCRAVEKWITIQSNAIQGRSGERILMSGDAGFKHVEAVFEGFLKASSLGGPIGISCDLTALSDLVVETLAAHVAQFKEDREFWRTAECRILSDTAGILVLQFSDAEFKQIKLLMFTDHATQTGVTLYPTFDSNASYRATDGTVYTPEMLASGVPFEFVTPEYIREGYTLMLEKI